MTDIPAQKKKIDSIYNIQFTKPLSEYINTKNQKASQICIFDLPLLEAYVKKYFIDVYLPSTTNVTWKDRMPKKQKSKKDVSTTEYCDINPKFLQQFADENKITVDTKYNYQEIIKDDVKTRAEISKFIIQQLVNKMALQYDKTDILQLEIPDIPVETILPEDGIIEGKQEKSQYKCILTYKTFLSQVKDELNNLKQRYGNMLKIIMKNINNQVLNQLRLSAEENKKYYTIVVEEQKPTKKVAINENEQKKFVVKSIDVKGTGASFTKIVDGHIHNILKTLQERQIDTTDKKQQFNINHKNFEKLQEIYKQIINYKQDTKLLQYDISQMTTFVNRFLKQAEVVDGGVSVPVTQFYIQQYLPNIISQCVNRFNYFADEKKTLTSLFQLENNDDIVDQNCVIELHKQITYVVKPQAKAGVTEAEAPAEAPADVATEAQDDPEVI